MDWRFGIWLVAGLALGVVHACGLWRSVNHTTSWSAFYGTIRLLIVGLLLTGSAILDGILPAATGWAGGFFVSVGVVIAMQWWRRGRRVAS